MSADHETATVKIDRRHKRLENVTPEQAYQLVTAALDVIGAMTPATYRRIAQATADGTGTPRPLISGALLVALIGALDDVLPGSTARVIKIADRERNGGK
jgi:hypothetical protein